MLGRILENASFLVSDSELLSRTLGTRIETETLRCSQTAREVYDMQESGGRILVRKEVPEESGKKPSEVELARASGAPPRGPRAVRGGEGCGGTCAAPSGTRKPRRSISETLNFLPDSTKCYYVFPEYWFYGLEQKCQMKPEGLEADSALNEKPLTQSRDVENGPIERSGEKEREKKGEMQLLEFLYQPAASAVLVLIGSSCEYGVLIYDSESPSLNASSSFRSEAGDHVETKTSSSTFSAVWEDRRLQTTEKQSAPDTCFDGFRIIYNNNKDSLNDDEDDTIKVVFTGSPTDLKKRSFMFATGESENKMADRKTNSLRCSDEKPRLSVSLDKRSLPYKSNSSPKENTLQAEFGQKEHRPRRSLILAREIEKDCQSFKKRRLPLDKGEEIRRTGSAEKDRSFSQKASALVKEAFRSLLFTGEVVPESERKGVDRKMLVLENDGKNVKKEVFAVFNSVKELSAGRGEAKGGKGRMSLLIMISRK